MEVPEGQVNFRGSLPCSQNNVLQPMLHPVCVTTITAAAAASDGGGDNNNNVMILL